MRYEYFSAMSEKYKARDPEGIYFITTTIVDWVDLFMRPECTAILIESIKYCLEFKGLNVHAYVIMSNHIHLIVSTKEGVALGDIMRDMKKFTAKKFVEYLDSGGGRTNWMLNKFSFAAKNRGEAKRHNVWKSGFHPILLDTNLKKEKALSYIHQNPVKAGIVYMPEHFVHSSAREYVLGDKGPFDLVLI